jgi:hypothetical protein
VLWARLAALRASAMAQVPGLKLRWRPFNVRAIMIEIEQVITRANSAAIQQQVDEETNAARMLGIFGSPTFVVGQEIFWGDDRLEDALNWVGSSYREDAIWQQEQTTSLLVWPEEVLTMHKTIIILTAALAMAGCSSTRDRVVATSALGTVLMAPQSAMRQAPTRVAAQAEDPSIASLKPGRTYVASFPEADRRAACERLNYEPGTSAYRKCLEGDFPENPYFAQLDN